MILLRLALLSLRARGFAAALTVLATALGVALYLGVGKLQEGARASFADAIAGTDLIVGARSGGVQLLLHSVFRMGSTTNNMSWRAYQEVAAMPGVEWIVPLSLGDSHRGFRVLGTSRAYFERYRFRGGRGIEFAAGRPFEDVFDAVLGAEVAARLGYAVGDEIVVSHGLASFVDHDDKPFTVAGVLARTGTPVDRTVHVSLEGIEAIHVDWRGGARIPGLEIPAEAVRRMDLTPQAVTAALVGVSSRLRIFSLQREINEHRAEPLTAILPGVALQELWSVVGAAERALAAVAAMVAAAALVGMVATTLAGLEARRREIAILRAVGARPRAVAGLLAAEAGALSLAAVALGFALAYGGLALLRPYLEATHGLYLRLTPPGAGDLAVLAAIAVAGTLAGLVPAWRAYRMSLAEGLTPRV